MLPLLCLSTLVFGSQYAQAHTFEMTRIPVQNDASFDNVGSVLFSAKNSLIISAPEADNSVGRVVLYQREYHDADFVMVGEQYGRLAGEGFGLSVVAVDNYMFVGAPYRSGYLNNRPYLKCGGVYVFSSKNTSDYTVIESDITIAYNLFGSALAANDAALVIGSPGYNGNMGHVTVFKLNPLGFWERLVGISTPHTVGEAKFGMSLALYGRILAVGSPGDIVNGHINGAGSISIYGTDETFSTWTMENYVTASNPIAGGAFGISLGVYDRILVVGSTNANGHFEATGAAYVFEYTTDDDGDSAAKTWNEVSMLIAHDGMKNDAFGCSVGVYGETIAIGACGEEGKKIAATNAAWQYSDGENCGDYSDVSCVPFRGDYVIQGDNAGAVYLYSFDEVKGSSESSWAEIRKVIPEASGPGWMFGKAVVVNGDTVLIGAPGAYAGLDSQQTGAVFEVKVDWIYYRNSIKDLSNVITGVIVVAGILILPGIAYIVYLLRTSEYCESWPSVGELLCGGFQSVASTDNSSDKSVTMRSTHGLLEDGSTATSSTFNIESGLGHSSKQNTPPKAMSDWGISRPSRKKTANK